ncbi:MAG: YggT family protein [Polyangiaceae bacterium]|nr:YggT family protein [Polyangiaceae bacterium]
MTSTVYTRADSLSVASPRRRRVLVVARIARILDYVFGLLYALLLVRLVLDFLSARPSAGFVQIVRGVTDPFYAPFKGIVGTGSIEGAPVVWPLVVAIVGYMLLHAGIRGALRLVR